MKIKILLLISLLSLSFLAHSKECLPASKIKCTLSFGNETKNIVLPLDQNNKKTLKISRAKGIIDVSMQASEINLNITFSDWYGLTRAVSQKTINENANTCSDVFKSTYKNDSFECELVE